MKPITKSLIAASLSSFPDSGIETEASIETDASLNVGSDRSIVHVEICFGYDHSFLLNMTPHETSRLIFQLHRALLECHAQSSCRALA